MEKDLKPKKKIFSKRVLVAFGIISFILIVGSLFSIISIDREPVEGGKSPRLLSIENKSEEVDVENGEDEATVGEFSDFFDIFGDFAPWIWMPLVGYFAWKFFNTGRRSV